MEKSITVRDEGQGFNREEVANQLAIHARSRNLSYEGANGRSLFRARRLGSKKRDGRLGVGKPSPSPSFAVKQRQGLFKRRRNTWSGLSGR